VRFRTDGVRSSTRARPSSGVRPRDRRKHYKRIIVTTRAKAIGTAAVLLLATVGCAPGTPDEDSWRADATRAVGDVASAVQTAQLALAQSEAGHLSHAYLQSVLVDAERTGGMAAQTLSSVQPPDGERQRSSEVLDTLDKATGLVTDARIAVDARESEQYAELVTDLRRTAEDLQHLESTLEHPPS